MGALTLISTVNRKSKPEIPLTVRENIRINKSQGSYGMYKVNKFINHNKIQV